MHGNHKLGEQVCGDDIEHARVEGVELSPGVLPWILPGGGGAGGTAQHGASCQVEEDEGKMQPLLPSSGEPAPESRCACSVVFLRGG